MNIFVLSTNPIQCARYHCDRDLSGAAEVYASILQGVYLHQNGGPDPGRHILYRWAKGQDAFYWLVQLTRAVLQEQAYRFGLCDEAAKSILDNIVHEDDSCAFSGLPRFIQLVQYTLPGRPVDAYRQFYLQNRREASWTVREAPGWWSEACFQYALRF